MPEILPAGTLIAVVLAVIGAEVLALLVLFARGRALARQMLPGASAGLFLALALRDLQAGSGLLALWLACAGVAHGLDWWLRARR